MPRTTRRGQRNGRGRQPQPETTSQQSTNSSPPANHGMLLTDDDSPLVRPQSALVPRQSPPPQEIEEETPIEQIEEHQARRSLKRSLKAAEFVSCYSILLRGQKTLKTRVADLLCSIVHLNKEDWYRHSRTIYEQLSAESKGKISLPDFQKMVHN